MRAALHVGRYIDAITITIVRGQSRKRIRLTEDEANKLAHRLMSYAAGGYGSEIVVDKEDV